MCMICRLIIFYTIAPFFSFFWHLYYCTILFFVSTTWDMKIHVQVYLFRLDIAKPETLCKKTHSGRCLLLCSGNMHAFLQYTFQNEFWLLSWRSSLYEKFFILRFWILCSEPVEVTDLLTLHELVYDENNEENFPRKFCISTKLARSEVAFFVQAIAFLLVITFCLR